ncbi:MAG: DUF5684 domain-containing protein [Actinobacteria bacterium]|nr:DUF5684 domain-containing protein [Actinomycetota bacterium]
MEDQIGFALGTAGTLIGIIIGIGLYIYIAVCLQTIARKTDTPNGWLAWIPIANLYLLCKLGGKPGWWLILLFIPIVNIIIQFIVWIGIANQRNKPVWLGVVWFIPVLNLITTGILAFSE